MQSLISYLTGDLSYESSWGVYAEKIGGVFTANSPARFGQRIFDNGGMRDDCEFFATNEQIVDARTNYCGTDDDASEFYEEWAEQYIEEMNYASV